MKKVPYVLAGLSIFLLSMFLTLVLYPAFNPGNQVDTHTSPSTITSTAIPEVPEVPMTTPTTSVTVTQSPTSTRPPVSQPRGENNIPLAIPRGIKVSEAGLLPGTDILIVKDREGERISTEACTVAFSLPTDNGYVAVTAGHCGAVGKEVFSVPTGDYFDSAHKLGVVSYSSTPNEDGQGDWGLIKLDGDADQPSNDSSVPMSLHLVKAEKGDELCKSGSRTGDSCGNQGEPKVRVNLGGFHGTGFSDSQSEASGIMSQVKVCSLPGDSGAPVYSDSGIIGVLSSSGASEKEETQGYCDSDPVSYYSPISDVLDQIKLADPTVRIAG